VKWAPSLSGLCRAVSSCQARALGHLQWRLCPWRGSSSNSLQIGKKQAGEVQVPAVLLARPRHCAGIGPQTLLHRGFTSMTAAPAGELLAACMPAARLQGKATLAFVAALLGRNACPFVCITLSPGVCHLQDQGSRAAVLLQVIC